MSSRPERADGQGRPALRARLARARLGHGPPTWRRTRRSIPDPATTAVSRPSCARRSRRTWRSIPRPAPPRCRRCEAAQRLHGWCSPEAIEQVACVMGLTPADLAAVATFYDMLETEPVGRHSVYVCTNISCSLCGADALLAAVQEAAADGAGWGCRIQRARVRVPRRVRHRADGLRRRRLRRPALDPRTCRRCSTTARRDGQCCRRSSSRANGSPTRTQTPRSGWAEIDPQPSTKAHDDGWRPPGGWGSHPPVLRHRRARAEHARGLPAPRRLRGAQKGPADDARGRARGARSLRPARARRRGLRDGQEGLVPAERLDGQVPRLQRRRVRAGHVQGPRTDAEEPAHADRGDRDRLLRGGDQPLVHLHPRRVRACRPRCSTRRCAKPATPASSASRSSAPSTRCRSSCTAARAPTSAARRRACSIRSRASAATRA